MSTPTYEALTVRQVIARLLELGQTVGYDATVTYSSKKIDAGAIGVGYPKDGSPIVIITH